MQSEQMSALIGTVYAAVRERNGWQGVVEAIAAAWPGYGVALRVRRGSPETDLLVTAGYAPGVVEDFVANHAIMCPWNDIERDSQVGVPYATEDVMPLASISYSRFYRNWVVPNGLGGGFGVKICQFTDCQASLVVDGSPERADADKSAILDFLHHLTPHLRGAFDLGRQLVLAREEGLMNGLLRGREPTAVLDSGGGIVAMNTAMEGLISRGVVQMGSGRRFRLPRTDDQAWLTALLLDPIPGRAVTWPQFMSVDIPNESGPNILEIDALPPDNATDARETTKPFGVGDIRTYYVATLRLRSRMGSPSVDHIRTGLGLTPKQAEAVWSLINGESIDKQAHDRGLSVDGVRWHFKNIYQRTGCSSQAELVRLVVSLFGRA